MHVRIEHDPRPRGALEATPEKKAQGWAERVLGPTVQWLRKKLFAAPKA